MEFDGMKYGKRIFWGIIFVTFHINLGTFKILPEWFGWCLVVSSIVKIMNSELFEKAASNLKKAVGTGVVLIGLTFICWFTDLSTTSLNQYSMSIYPITMLLEVMIFYYLINGIAAMDFIPCVYYEKRLSIYLCIMIFGAVGAWFASIKESAFVFLFTLIVIILRLWMASLIRSFFRENFHEHQEKL